MALHYCDTPAALPKPACHNEEDNVSGCDEYHKHDVQNAEGIDEAGQLWNTDEGYGVRSAAGLPECRGGID